MHFKAIFFGLIIFLPKVLFSQDGNISVVEATELTLNRSLTLQRSALAIKNAEGNYRIQKGTFDYQLISGIALNRDQLNMLDGDPRAQLISGNLKSRSSIASMGAQKRFRNGMSANLEANYLMAVDNLPTNRFNESAAAYLEDHSFSSQFSLTQPLIRGRGRHLATALEQSSLLNIESAQQNYDFTNSTEILQTVSSYWQYLSAYQSVEIYEENVDRVRKVLEITEELVKADKKPSGDLAQIRADLANQERQKSVALQILYGAKLNLGRSIGLTEEESKSIADPSDEFPTVLGSGYDPDLALSQLLAIAMDNRNDIDAFKKSQDALELQLAYSENNRKAQLDLSGVVNYGGMNFGNGIGNALSSLTQTQGRNLGFGIRLDFQFPILNNQATGSYINQNAWLNDQQIAIEDLERNIRLNISIALNNLHNSVIILNKASESLDFYKEVYSNEQVKFQNGLTTLLNLILFQERLTIAQLEYLQAQQQFATAIVNLRFETGTLQSNSQETAPVISRELFYTIPELN